MKKKGEGLTDENKQIMDFLEEERKTREEEIRQEERQIKHSSPIVGYTKRMPNIIHGNAKPKRKTLEETWREEDLAKREWEENEAEQKRRKR